MNNNTMNTRYRSSYGNIFLIIGPSGVGKNTLINELTTKDKKLKFIPSITTREMRDSEQEGMPYHFVTKKKFEEFRNNNELLEWQTIFDNHYGSSLFHMKQELKNGYDVITDMEVIGACNAISRLPLNICTIFVSTSSENKLKERILNRNDETDNEVNRRIRRSIFEIKISHMFDYLILNDSLGNAVRDLENIIHTTRIIQFRRYKLSLIEKFPLVRTIQFLIKSKENNLNHKIIKLKLNSYDNEEELLQLALDIISFQSSIELNVSSYKIISTNSSIITHSFLGKYNEMIVNAIVDPKTTQDYENLLNAIKNSTNKYN